MTDKFKVGDRVKCIDNLSRSKITDSLHYITIGKTYYVNYPIDYTKEDKIVIVNDLNILYEYHSNRFELVERKIDDTWVKAEDLDKMEKIKFTSKKDLEKIIKYGYGTLGGWKSICLSEEGMEKEEFNKKMEEKEEFKCGDVVECIMDIPEHKVFRGAVYKVEDHPNFGLIIPTNSPDKRIVGIDVNFYYKHFRLTKKHVEEKEEFKVDKLGWYLFDSGLKYKLLHKLSDGTFIAIEESNYEPFIVKNGEVEFIENSISKAIKYLGPELPKEPRVFEFEAKVKKQYNNTIELNLYKWSTFIENIEDKKWHFTMKEILE